MKLPTKMLFVGIILNFMILGSTIVIGIVKPESWLTLRMLYIFYYPVVWAFNLLGYNPTGLSAIICFIIFGIIIYGTIFWLIGLILNKKLKNL